MNRPTLFAVVSLSGAAVLVLEILGTRVLGPFYGVSLFLWSALISVTLAALACGYALGGRLASRNPGAGTLSTILLAAGVWVLAVPWIRTPVVHAAAGAGLQGAVLIAAVLLFFVPLALLGMVSPYAIRLASRSVEEVGRVSGDLFAVSTLASVLAAVATGFWLIPTLGVTKLLLVVAGALFLAAALARAGAGSRAGAIVVLVVGAGLAAGSWLKPVALPPGVLAAEESPYAELRVIDHHAFRYLLIDGGAHTVFDRETGVPYQAYVYAAELAADITGKNLGRLLLVGLGGGGTAEVFSRRGWDVDAVEIDPEIPALARRYFGLKPQHAHVFIDEGRRFLQRSRDRYDVILFDAFGSASIPFHLVTREAFAEAKARLAPGGILALNVETVGWQDPLAHALVATLRTQFAHVTALPTGEPPNQLGNEILMASDRPLELDPDLLGDPVGTLSDDDEHFRVVTRMHAWDNQYVPNRGVVLTDDWNPVDLRTEEINRAARKVLHQLLPDSLTGI